MNRLRSLLYALLFYPGTVLYVLAGFVVMPFGRSAVRRDADAWAAFNRWCARYILGIRTRVEGEVPKGAALVALKHQSMFETTEIALILDTPATVMKSDLAHIPLWGKLTQVYGIIPVDREGGASQDAPSRGGSGGGRAADRDLPGGDAGSARRAAAAPVRLCGALPRAQAAGRPGGSRQRPAVAEARGQAPGSCHLPLRRADPAGPSAIRNRGEGPRRHQRLGRHPNQLIEAPCGWVQASSRSSPPGQRRRRRLWRLSSGRTSMRSQASGSRAPAASMARTTRPWVCGGKY
jgi:hypothetical protein